MQRRIVFCGAPQVGKTTILAALLASQHALPLTAQATVTERLVRGDVAVPPDHFTLITISGSFWYDQTPVMNWLLPGIHGVVYVGAPIPHDAVTQWGADAPAQERERQYLFWQYYTAHAAAASALWTTIPWIFVLNKSDVGTEYPLLEWMPQTQIPLVVRSIAPSGEGIGRLWERMRVLYGVGKKAGLG